jgi:non-canonical purine NTP pyrophosphatase (RdgB/HAM1 family)
MFNPSCLTHYGLLHRSQWMLARCVPLPPEDRRAPISRTPISRTTETRLVIASGNPYKVAEIAAMLEMVDLEVLPQPAGLEIEETGSTYAANARLKAETVARLTGCWALADDSGLEVDALGDRPGLYSARYAPSDPEKIHRLLHELGDGLYRGGRFVSAMALADPAGITRLEGCGICHGTILREPQGNGGGYDPIFWVREAGCSYAQMSAHLKSKLGSRGKAARELAPALRQLLGLGG